MGRLVVRVRRAGLYGSSRQDGSIPESASGSRDLRRKFGVKFEGGIAEDRGDGAFGRWAGSRVSAELDGQVS